MYGDLGCTYWMASASAQAVLGTFAVGEDSGDDCGIGYVGDDSKGRCAQWTARWLIASQSAIDREKCVLAVVPRI